MIRKFLLITLPFIFFACTSQQINQTLNAVLAGGLTQEDIGRGLKAALDNGVQRGVSELSANGGYFDDLAYRILLPEKAQEVTNKLQNIPGFSDLEQVLIRKINQGAEDAAEKAGPIFVNAIRSMTIEDAMGILRGDNNAATDYLKRVTFQQLYGEFEPVIRNSLDKFDANTVWSDASRAYNNFPLTRNPVNEDLTDHVTNEALDGLFRKIALEEENIRQNVNARTTELLRKVFALQDEPANGK